MDLYAENILDHYYNPRNFGKLKDANYKARDANPMCGDKLNLYIRADGKGKITGVKFDGKGCAISQASASMLSEKLIGKTLLQASKINNDDIYKMLAVPISESRVKCALLSLSTLKKALVKKQPSGKKKK